MQCSEARELLSPYHDGELSDDDRLAIEVHLTQCRACQQELESFQKLSLLASRLPDPAVPATEWLKLEPRLLSRSSELAGKIPPAMRWSRWKPTVIVLMLLVTATCGLFLWHGDHNHAAVNLNPFLEKFDRNVDEAQFLLLTNYQGRPATLAEAPKVLKYMPVVAKGMPSGYHLHAAYFLKMPCCECLEAVYARPNGGFVAVFEHEKDQPLWFGHRPSIQCECAGKPTRLVQLDGTLAATCLLGTRYVTIVGPHSVDEVSEIVHQLAEVSQRPHSTVNETPNGNRR